MFLALMPVLLFAGGALFFFRGSLNFQKTSARVDSYYHSCDNVNAEDKENCFINVARRISGSETLETIFGVYSRFALSGDVECHSLAHTVGKIAQEKANSDGMSVLDTVDAKIFRYCGWGFWHGYMASLSEKTQSDPDTLRRFCDDQGKRYEAELDCFHGIGLGAIGDPPPKDLWGKPQELLRKAFLLCDQAATDDSEETCYQGGFHQLIDFMVKDSFGFVHPDPDDPFDLCFAQEEKYRHACFVQVAPGVYERSNGTAFQNNTLMKKLQRTSYFPQIISAMVAGAVNASNTDTKLDQFLAECRQATQLPQSCIEGILLGEFGKGNEDEKATILKDWCGSLNSEPEQAFCRTKLSAL